VSQIHYSTGSIPLSMVCVQIPVGFPGGGAPSWEGWEERARALGPGSPPGTPPPADID
jgi:hypothetical protein